MLVLTRKPGQRILIGDSIVLTVVALHGDRVRIGLEAPAEVAIVRAEIADRPTTVVPAPAPPKASA